LDSHLVAPVLRRYGLAGLRTEIWWEISPPSCLHDTVFFSSLYIFFVRNPEEKRLFGRRCYTQQGNNAMNVRETGYYDWIHLVEDRVHEPSVVNTIMNHRVSWKTRYFWVAQRLLVSQRGLLFSGVTLVRSKHSLVMLRVSCETATKNQFL
jgi:hypothetical protein